MCAVIAQSYERIHRSALIVGAFNDEVPDTVLDQSDAGGSSPSTEANLHRAMAWLRHPRILVTDGRYRAVRSSHQCRTDGAAQCTSQYTAAGGPHDDQLS